VALRHKQSGLFKFAAAAERLFAGLIACSHQRRVLSP
jgi:hypothetical protein